MSLLTGALSLKVTPTGIRAGVGGGGGAGRGPGQGGGGGAGPAEAQQTRWPGVARCSPHGQSGPGRGGQKAPLELLTSNWSFFGPSGRPGAAVARKPCPGRRFLSVREREVGAKPPPSRGLDTEQRGHVSLAGVPEGPPCGPDPAQPFLGRSGGSADTRSIPGAEVCAPRAAGSCAGTAAQSGL